MKLLKGGSTYLNHCSTVLNDFYDLEYLLSCASKSFFKSKTTAVFERSKKPEQKPPHPKAFEPAVRYTY